MPQTAGLSAGKYVLEGRINPAEDFGGERVSAKLDFACGSRLFSSDSVNMPLTKAQKQKILEELRDKIARQKIILFVDFSGLKAKELFNLRKRLNGLGAKLKVAKKTLISFVFKEKKLEINPRKLPGEVALVFGFEDEILPAKTVYQFSQEFPNLKILGGIFEKEVRGAEDIIELAQLPSKEELLARLVGSVNSPVSNFVRVLEANIKGLIYILSQIKV